MLTKKWILQLSCFCFVLLSFSAQAQVLGFKAGLSVSDLRGDLATRSRFDAAVGFYADLDFNDRLSFQVEALFNRVGATDRDKSEQIRLHYIALPIMVKYDVSKRISFYAGPQVSFLSTAQIYLEDEVQDIQDDINEADFGLAGGFIYQFPSSLNIDIRFYQGMSKAFRTSFARPVLKNQIFSVSLGYLLVK